ncbi:MAG TPA: ferric reductase-like transmembrane domain-containing protein [Ktedonobacteraceae bacterium]|nr:ferric reductase-like transmembrane domain-containing protein [Ktedonobacteraceae bacterium]
MSIWQTVTWNVARTGGFTAYILLTLAVAIGLALTMQLQSPSYWPRLINSELHNFVTLLSVVFVSIHILAVWVDPFTRFGWNEVFIPFVSHYRATWMALGIIALYLGIAIGISTWLRPLIGYSWWRRLHILTLVVFGLVTLHGIATGSDTQTWWGLVIYGGSIALVGGLLCWRLLVPVNDRARSHPVMATLVGLTILAGLIFTVAGPLHPGWNALANGATSGNTIAQSVVPSPTQQAPSTSRGGNNPFASSFTASFQGTLAKNGPDSNGNVILHMNATLSDGAQGVLVIVMQGTQESFRGQDGGLSITSTQVKLGQDATKPLYQGYLTDLRSNEVRWRMSALLSNVSAGMDRLQVQIEMQVDSSGQVAGVIQGIPVQGSPSNPNTPSTPTTQQV